MINTYDLGDKIKWFDFINELGTMDVDQAYDDQYKSLSIIRTIDSTIFGVAFNVIQDYQDIDFDYEALHLYYDKIHDKVYLSYNYNHKTIKHIDDIIVKDTGDIVFKTAYSELLFEDINPKQHTLIFNQIGFDIDTNDKGKDF